MLIFPSTSLLTGDYSIQFMETLPFSLFGPKSGSIPNSYLSRSPRILFIANPVGSILNIHPEPITFHHLHRAITPDKATPAISQGLL